MNSVCAYGVMETGTFILRKYIPKVIFQIQLLITLLYFYINVETLTFGPVICDITPTHIKTGTQVSNCATLLN
jgi:hypothetical protein